MLTFFVHAQVKFDAKATGKHAEMMDSGKEIRETTKERKEQVLRMKEQAKARKVFKQKYDSIQSYRTDSLKSLHYDSLGLLQGDSLDIVFFSKDDSIAIANRVMNEVDFPEEYKELIMQPLIVQKPLKENLDSLAYSRAIAIIEDHAAQFLPNELGPQGDPLKDFAANPFGGEAPDLNEGLPDLEKPQKPNPNIVKPDAAKDLFKKIDPDQFKQVQANISKLKKKYSILPDTRYPEEGTKRNSIEDVPFSQRLYFGGNISLHSTDPIIMDSKLQVGYWMNKKWIVGIGGILREQLNKGDSTALTGDAYGCSVFSRYDLPKSFFAWIEVERQISKSLFKNESFNDTGLWQEAYLVGFGKEFKLGPVQMMSIILYDLNYKNNDLNARPIALKLGVRFSKRPKVGAK